MFQNPREKQLNPQKKIYFHSNKVKQREGELSTACLEVCVDPENVLWGAGNSCTWTTLDQAFE